MTRTGFWSRLFTNDRGAVRLPAGPYFQAADDGGGTPKKIEWTPEQQTEIDRTISARLAREKTAWEKKVGAGATAEEREELDRLRKAEQDRATAEAEKKGEWDRLKKSLQDEHILREQKWQKERGDLLGDLKRDRCDGAIIAAAAEYNAYSPAQVAKLLGDSITLDSARNVVVLDDEGNPALKGGNPLSVKDRVKAFLDANSHLVKATQVAGGSGSKGGKTNAGDGQGHQTDVDKLKGEITSLQAEMETGGPPSTAHSVKLMQLKRKLKDAEAKAA